MFTTSLILPLFLSLSLTLSLSLFYITLLSISYNSSVFLYSLYLSLSPSFFLSLSPSLSHRFYHSFILPFSLYLLHLFGFPYSLSHSLLLSPPSLSLFISLFLITSLYYSSLYLLQFIRFPILIL